MQNQLHIYIYVHTYYTTVPLNHVGSLNTYLIHMHDYNYRKTTISITILNF